MPILKLDNKNLVNINYINYKDTKFDIIDYYGGIIQFLPFYPIFKKLIEISNKKDNKYKELNDEINYFSNFIIKLIIKKLFSTNDKRKLFKKHIYFVYYLLLDLNIYLTINIEEYEEKKDEYEGIYNCLDLLIMIYYNQLNQLNSNIKGLIEDFNKNKKNANLNYFKRPTKTFNQLYRANMKRLFSFNSFWSKRNVFFPKTYNYNNIDNKTIKIKYKQLNYYTKNFQFPYFYPILEYKKYLPKFKTFKGELFKDNENIILEYNFKLNHNEKALDIIKRVVSTLNKTTKDIHEKCCLVKNTHHINGKLFLFKKNNDKSNNKFNLVFKINKKDKEGNKTCNKRETNKNNKDLNQNESKNEQNTSKIELNKDDDYSKNLCYGAIFPSPEEKRNIVINSKNILFILIRTYYHRLSAFEIFTLNKSYYFNFHNSFGINNFKKNKFLNEFINN